MSHSTTQSSSPPSLSSSYRVKFHRREFLKLIEIAEPQFIFHVKRMYFFAFQVFVVYSLSCVSSDFENLEIYILQAIEFSNRSWDESRGWID